MNAIFSKLITFTCLTVISAIAFQSEAQAFNFSLDPTSNKAAGEFKYDLELADGESITKGDGTDILADFLTLTNFTGTVTANNPYTLNGSGSSSANFSVNTDTTGVTTLDDVVTINATNFSEGMINYNLSYSGGSNGGMITGPVTAVPFEPSANLGIFTILGFVGFNHYRKKLKGQN